MRSGKEQGIGARALVAALSLLALALTAGAPADARRTAPVRTCAAADTFRVVTYNIRLDVAVDGDNDWAHRRPLFLSQLALLHPAILGMQEVVPGQRADLDATLPGYASLGGGRDDGKKQGEASPLYVDRARFRVLASGMFWLSPTPDRPSLGWDAAFRRVATWAHLTRKDGAGPVLAVNTHWDHVGKQARRESARQLLGWVAQNRRAGEQVVLLGDFNAGSDDEALRLALSGDAVRLEDSQIVAGAKATGNSASFNDFRPLPPPASPIDHILVGKGTAVTLHHILAENFDGRVASDHFPVVADIAFAGKCSRQHRK